MKAIITNNNIQVLSEVPSFWKNKTIYNFLKPPIKPGQKYGKLSDSLIDEETKTITLPVIEMTNEEYDDILAKEGKLLLEELKYLVFDLEEGAKKIAIGKDGSKEYIEAQVRIYEKKYKIAKGDLPDYSHLIESEAAEAGVSFDNYKTLIIQKYEAGAALYNSFTIMVDRSRIKVLKLIEVKKNYKAKMILKLMKSIKIDTSITEIQTTMSNILNIQ